MCPCGQAEVVGGAVRGEGAVVGAGRWEAEVEVLVVLPCERLW
jgi:hypothetical protein